MLRFHLLFIVIGVVLLFLLSSVCCSGYGGLQLCKLQGKISSSNWSCEQPCELFWINCEQFQSKVATYTVNRLHFASFHRQNHMIGPAAVCTNSTASAPFVLPNDCALIVVLFGEESIQLKTVVLSFWENKCANLWVSPNDNGTHHCEDDDQAYLQNKDKFAIIRTPTLTYNQDEDHHVCNCQDSHQTPIDHRPYKVVAEKVRVSICQKSEDLHLQFGYFPFRLRLLLGFFGALAEFTELQKLKFSTEICIKLANPGGERANFVVVVRWIVF